MLILQHSKITFYTLVSRHIMKRYLGLESKSLGGCLGHLALALIALSWLWNLMPDCVCLMANHVRGHVVCNILTGGQIDAYWPEARERFFIVRAGCTPLSPPFLSLLVSLPFLSRHLEVGPYSFPSLPSIHFPSHVNYECQKP